MLIADLLLAIPKNGPHSSVQQNSAGVFNFLLDYTALDSFAASGCLCKRLLKWTITYIKERLETFKSCKPGRGKDSFKYLGLLLLVFIAGLALLQYDPKTGFVLLQKLKKSALIL